MSNALKRSHMCCLLAFLVSGFLITSCDKSDERLRRELKREAQRAVNDRKSSLRPLMDSICTLNYTSDLRRLTDSLYKVRKTEVEQIIDF